MNVTPKTKDENLSELLTGSLVYTGEEKTIASILFSDGHITIQGTNMGDVCTITPKGRAFISQGGYTAIEQEKERQFREAESAKEKDRQARLQEIEIQRLISERLMEKDHEFQARQNRSNRRNNIISGIIAAIITLAIQGLIMVL